MSQRAGSDRHGASGRRLLWGALIAVCLATGMTPSPARAATGAEITILSTMIANYTGVGEWGFSALVETPERRILFDTGFRADTVLTNARALGEDLATVDTVVLTHFHTDHTGGLLTLRETYRELDPKAFSTVFVARGFFAQRYAADGAPVYSLANADLTRSFDTPQGFRAAAEALGIRFVVIDGPTAIAEGLVLTGPIPRTHDERNVSPGMFLADGDARARDTIPESQVLGIRTAEGWVLLSGCGHAGMINAAEQLQRIEDLPIHLAIGGFHLFRADDATIAWTTNRLRDFGLRKLVGAHCTGAHATWSIAEGLSLPRSAVSLGAIGTRITADLEIVPASIE